MSRITWASASLGAQVVPVLLIHGLPAIIYPDGVDVSSFAIVTPDAAWWPGNVYANWASYAKPWMRLDDGITFSERAVPTATTVLDVSEVTINLSDVDQEATLLFDNDQSAAATFITASVDQFDTTINVLTTAAFPASGVLYIGLEAVLYTGTTPTSFTGCVRAQYGSVAANYTFSSSQGTGLGNPQVTSLPVEYVGRPTTLWLCEIENGEMVRVQLEHFGTVGTGLALTGGGESLDDGWMIPIDHAVKRMSQKIISNPVAVGGFTHAGNLNARALPVPTPPTAASPFAFSAGPSITSTDMNILLTGDAAAPDNGGWHPTRESYLTALNQAGNQLGLGAFSASITSDGLQVEWFSDPPTNRFYYVHAPCAEVGTQDTFRSRAFTPGERSFSANMGAMSEAWVPIFTGSPVYLNDTDFATVPPAYVDPDVSVILIFGDDKDLSTRRIARVRGQGTIGSANYLTCDALTTYANTRGASTGATGSSTPGGATLWEGGFYENGFIIAEPTTARLGLYVRGETWVEALQRVVVSLGAEYKFIYDAIDFTQMAAVAAAFPSPFPTRREYVIDLNTTLMSILQNEAALNGFALTVYRGRISITRVAEFALTEATTGTITNTDLHVGAPSPTYERGSDGIVNTYSVFSPDDGVTVNVSDRTSFAKYGGQGTISAVMPRTLLGGPRDGGRLYTQVFAQAVQVLGPLRYPYRHVSVRVPLNLYDYQIGDLIDLTLWRVPNGAGGRGITNVVAQILGREVVLFQESEGYVTYTLRLNPANISGYAPCGLVELNGIVGDFVTFDVTTVPGGFSGTGADGLTFEAGDLVQLIEIDASSPIAATTHEVVSVATNTLQLNPAPSPAFAALAASGSLKVMVVYDVWGAVVAGNRTNQQKYCYLANADGTLDASTNARVYAA